MSYWCESCARKSNCYTIRNRPKCFVAITNSERIAEQTETQSNARKFLGYACETCKHRYEEWDSEACDGCCENNDHYEQTEPQTEVEMPEYAEWKESFQKMTGEGEE